MAGFATSAFAAIRHAYFYVATGRFFADAQAQDGSYRLALPAAAANLLLPLWHASRRPFPLGPGFTFAIPPSTPPLHLSIHCLGPPFPHVLAVIPAPLGDPLRWDFHRRCVFRVLVHHSPSQFFVGSPPAACLPDRQGRAGLRNPCAPGCICRAACVTRPWRDATRHTRPRE